MLPRQKHDESEEFSLSSQERSITAELYQQYGPTLFSYIRQHISGVDDAEDLLLDVFLTAFEHEATLTLMLEDEQRAWMWTVTRNRITDYYRRMHRRSQVSLEHIETKDASTPEQAALQQEEHDELHTYLAQLSGVQQEVLRLRFTGGLRCTEIATVLNKREGTVRTILSRALNTLRTIYKQELSANSK